MADNYKRNIEDIIYNRIMIKTYANQIKSRILILDNKGEVLIDNFYSYNGKKIINQEIKNALKGLSTSGIYQLNNREVLQLSVPIVKNMDGENTIIGTVLISKSLDNLNYDIDNLKSTIITLATISLVITLIMGIISTTTITKPLRDLSFGVNSISQGKLGYKIESNVKGEIGDLINTFNEMSLRLKNIETNRKSFINSISHELKTPLTSINALIDSLSFGDSDLELYKEYMKDIRGETERMENLVNYLMDSIKLEDISLDLREENISQILRDTIKLLTPYGNKYDVKIIDNIEEDIFIRCDKDKIKEVFINLVENGIKYRDDVKNQKHIIISLKREKGNNLTIAIEDNGIGIDKKDLSNIFQRGFRIFNKDISPYNPKEGHGIGLAIVKNIIDKHKWNISAESNLGLGTKFIIKSYKAS